MAGGKKKLFIALIWHHTYAKEIYLNACTLKNLSSLIHSLLGYVAIANYSWHIRQQLPLTLTGFTFPLILHFMHGFLPYVSLNPQTQSASLVTLLRLSSLKKLAWL